MSELPADQTAPASQPFDVEPNEKPADTMAKLEPQGSDELFVDANEVFSNQEDADDEAEPDLEDRDITLSRGPHHAESSPSAGEEGLAHAPTASRQAEREESQQPSEDQPPAPPLNPDGSADLTSHDGAKIGTIQSPAKRGHRNQRKDRQRPTSGGKPHSAASVSNEPVDSTDTANDADKEGDEASDVRVQRNKSHSRGSPKRYGSRGRGGGHPQPKQSQEPLEAVASQPSAAENEPVHRRNEHRSQTPAKPLGTAPYVNPSRILSGGADKKRLTPEELEKKMEEMKKKNAEILRKQKEVEEDEIAWQKSEAVRVQQERQDQHRQREKEAQARKLREEHHQRSRQEQDGSDRRSKNGGGRSGVGRANSSGQNKRWDSAGTPRRSGRGQSEGGDSRDQPARSSAEPHDAGAPVNAEKDSGPKVPGRGGPATDGDVVVISLSTLEAQSFDLDEDVGRWADSVSPNQP